MHIHECSSHFHIFFFCFGRKERRKGLAVKSNRKPLMNLIPQVQQLPFSAFLLPLFVRGLPFPSGFNLCACFPVKVRPVFYVLCWMKDLFSAGCHIPICINKSAHGFAAGEHFFVRKSLAFFLSSLRFARRGCKNKCCLTVPVPGIDSYYLGTYIP